MDHIMDNEHANMEHLISDESYPYVTKRCNIMNTLRLLVGDASRCGSISDTTT